MFFPNNSSQVIANSGERSNDTLKKKSTSRQRGHDVWYRSVVKAFIRANRPTPYKESFQTRVVHSVGIPVAEIKGLHAMFRPEYRHYSPLQGMIFAYNNFINNLYRYGTKDQEPAVELIHELFHILPGGEIQPTHASRNAGAHLSPALVGDLFECCERLRSSLVPKDVTTAHQELADSFANLINEHPDYRINTERLHDDVRKAELEEQELKQKEADAAPVRMRIRQLEGDIIKSNRHHIKRLQKEQKKKSTPEERMSEILAEISQRTGENEQAEQQLERLRTNVVTSLEFKLARKNLARAQEAVELERQDRVSLARILSKSFCTHEFELPNAESTLPKFSTTAILLAYLWRKYDSVTALQGYFESMSRLGGLNVPLETALEVVHISAKRENDASPASKENWHRNRSHPRRGGRVLHRMWTAMDVENAATIATSGGFVGNSARPPIIQFSYVTWAGYSEFPDCAENALRNLLNQIVFDPDTGKLDHEVLVELKEHHYPELSDRIINFYRRNPNPQDAISSSVAVEWIGVLSTLNTLRGWTKDDAMFIRYRREKEEQNIASPLRNALRTINALFGVTDVEGAELVSDIVDHINDFRNSGMDVDLSGVKKDGFGLLALTDGKIRYELQSYKPVHFGFVQTEAQNHTKSLVYEGRCEFRAFLRLMRHSNVLPKDPPSDSEYFQQLALASLFIPYKLRRNTLGRFFRHAPAHYPLLFADLDSETYKQEVLKWAKTSIASKDEHLRDLVARIEAYVEPKFAPTKKKNPETS